MKRISSGGRAPLIPAIAVVSLILLLSAGPSSAVDLTNYKVVDLTHTLNGGAVYYPGDSPVSVEAKGEKGDSARRLYAQFYDISMSDRSGTHVVLPSRYVENGVTAGMVPADSLVLNAVVINVEGAAAKDPDYALDSGHIMRWEEFNGPVPSGSAVLIETGWDRFWGDGTIYFNFDKNKRMHYPGLSVDAVKYLTEKRGVKVIGIDTPGLDPGFTRKFEASSLMAEAGGIVLLNLKELGELPPTGSAVFIGLLPLSAGGGSPARILGLIPNGRE